ncbi:MAG: hypothetical protein JOZ51_11600 [Chloroflexi bacterium]|nr:hypothetical protein [Chloroflexota bacterium]
MSYKIEAVAVNHNTSPYMELMLRSFFKHYSADLPFSLTVFDNASTDDMTDLVAFAAQMNVPIVQSGYTTATRNNSHGEILRHFVSTHPDSTHYLFLDADVCFVQPNTILTMLHELDGTPGAFGIGPRLSWDGIAEIPMAVRQANPDIGDARLHPCCALIRNTLVFQHVADLIGFSCVRYLWADADEYLDTFKLMTRVMQTHGLTHCQSSTLVQHFFAVSYQWDTEETIQHKARMRDEQLAALRLR